MSRVDDSSFLLLYPKFLELTAAYNFEFHWDESRILNRSRCAPCTPVDRWFEVKDVGINSVYAAGWGVLMRLANAINDTATAQLCAKEADISSSAIVSKMFDSSIGGFRSLFVDWDGQEKVSNANVVQNLLPLLLPSLPQHAIDAMIAEVCRCCTPLSPPLLLPALSASSISVAAPSQSSHNPLFADQQQHKIQQLVSAPNRCYGRFTCAVTPAPLPPPCSPALRSLAPFATVFQFCATFDADLMWRGPVWGFTNWLVMPARLCLARDTV